MTTQWLINDYFPDPKTRKGRWQIHRIIEGGMGIVYIVYDHEEHFVYAVKTYQDRLFQRNPQMADRFMQEALTWTNLDVHQNVVQAHFVQKFENKLFLFLEYVHGSDLSKWIGTRYLMNDLSKVVHFAIQFCDGMIHALSKGLKAHRDIKPQNCLISSDGMLKVTDFGLAKIFEDITSEGLNISKPNLTSLKLGVSQTGLAAGTPPYMAPEQFDDIKSVDVRADIYAFGVMLYEMITGSLPFVGKTLFEFEQLHKTQPPPVLRISNKKLDTIIQICLAKKPTKRFNNFDVIRAQLAELYETMTGELPPEPAQGVELNAIQWNNKGTCLGELGLHEQEISCYEQALTLNPQYAQAWYNKGLFMSTLGRHEEALKCYDKTLEIDNKIEWAWCNKGTTLTALGRYEEAIECSERALALNPVDEKAWINKGMALSLIGRTNDAMICYKKALEINPQIEDDLMNTMARSEVSSALYKNTFQHNTYKEYFWYLKGVMSEKFGRYEKALECYDHLLALNQNFEPAWNNKGSVLHNLGKYKAALVCYERAIKLNPKNDKAWYNTGAAYGMIHKYEKALPYYESALELNPRYENAWFNKGVALGKLKKYKEEIDCYQRVIELNPKSDDAWINMGMAWLKLEQYEDALTCFERAIQLKTKYVQAWMNKGVVLLNMGKVEDALQSFEEAKRLGHPDASYCLEICRQKLRIK